MTAVFLHNLIKCFFFPFCCYDIQKSLHNCLSGKRWKCKIHVEPLIVRWYFKKVVVWMWPADCLITQKTSRKWVCFSLEWQRGQNGVIFIHLCFSHLTLSPSPCERVEEKKKFSWLMDLLAIWTSVFPFIGLAGRGLGTVWQAPAPACTNTGWMHLCGLSLGDQPLVGCQSSMC